MGQVRFMTFEDFHGKKQTGSGKIRVHNLVKYWDEADIYKYGENPDTLIFQKVYVTDDYKFHKSFPNTKILDICDPDWMEHHYRIKETVDNVDAVVCPTEPLKEFIEQLTNKPVRIIKDRFDINEFPPPKKHKGETKRVVWFGYHHNSTVLKSTLYSIQKRELHLTIISDKDPMVQRYDEYFKDNSDFIQYDQANIYRDLQTADVAVLPKGQRAEDRFKSDNKKNISILCGLPVAQTADELDSLKTADQREAYKHKWYNKIKDEFDCRNSVKEYKDLIKELNG